MKLDEEIKKLASSKPNKAELAMASTLLDVIQGKIGTKDQRNAIIRIVKQVSKQSERDFNTNVAKALNKLGAQFKTNI